MTKLSPYLRLLYNNFTKKNGFLRQFIILLTGASLAQLITVLLSPVMSRIFHPDDFGSFALFVSVSAILVTFITGRYEQAILIPENEAKGIELARVALLFTLITSLIVTALLIILKTPLKAAFTDKRAAEWLYFIPLSLLLTGIYQILYNWSNRRGHFRRIAMSRIFQSSSTALGSILLGLWGWNLWGLIVGQLIGLCTGILILALVFFCQIKKKMVAKTQLNSLWKTAMEYRRFSFQNTFAQFLNSLGHHIPLVLLGAFFHTGIVGLYFFGYRLINLPLVLFGNSMSDLSYRKSMELIHKGEPLKSYMERMSAFLLILAVIPFSSLLLWGGPLFAFIFGPQWRTAGIYTQILTPSFFLRFLSSPLTLFAQKEKSDLLLKWQSVFFSSMVLVIIAGGLSRSAIITVVLISISNSLCYAWLLAINFRLSGADWKRVFKLSALLKKTPV